MACKHALDFKLCVPCFRPGLLFTLKAKKLTIGFTAQKC